MPPTEPLPADVRDELRELVDEYRTRCLWFLRPDLYPETRDQALRMLGYIERYGDLEAFRRAGRIRQRLMATDGEASARPTLKELLLAEAPRFEMPVPSRKKGHRQSRGEPD